MRKEQTENCSFLFFYGYVKYSQVYGSVVSGFSAYNRMLMRWLDSGKKVKHIGEKVGKVGMATGVDGIYETNYWGYSGYGYTFCDDTQ